MSETTSTRRLPIALRTEALEQLLTERGLVDPAAIDNIVQTYETAVGPMNGAKVIAKAWTDPDYRERLLAEGTAAIAELGFTGQEGEHIVVVENTADTHNVIVCSLCSCYPWPVLGCRPAGTRTRPTAPASCASRVWCWPRWALSYPPTPTSWSGTPPPRCAGWCCRSDRPASRICHQSSWLGWSPVMPWSVWRRSKRRDRRRATGHRRSRRAAAEQR